MNGDYSERLSQESECRNEEEYGILERASAIALGVLKEIEAGCWFCDRTQLGEFFDRGSENETFRLATKQETHDEFIRLGFHPEDNGEYYTNGHHDIFDAVEGNVLMGDDGHIYFIDTIIYPSDTGGLKELNGKRKSSRGFRFFRVLFLILLRPLTLARPKVFFAGKFWK